MSAFFILHASTRLLWVMKELGKVNLLACSLEIPPFKVLCLLVYHLLTGSFKIWSSILHRIRFYHLSVCFLLHHLVHTFIPTLLYVSSDPLIMSSSQYAPKQKGLVCMTEPKIWCQFSDYWYFQSLFSSYIARIRSWLLAGYTEMQLLLEM